MAGARSYFSYSVVRSVQSLNPSGDPILTSLKDVQWEILDSNNNPTTGYLAATGPDTIIGGTTDLNGLIEFWADPGLYVIKITDPSSRIANKNIYWDSVSGQIGGIPGDKIESETITTTQIKNAEVKTADLDSSAVQTTKIDNSAVTTAKIDNAAVTTAKIDNAAVTTAKIAPSGVTTEKIDAGAVTSAKIAPGTIAQSNIADGTYVPIGAIMPFALSAAPTGWLLCNGAAVTTSNAELRQLLIDSGNPYGVSGSNPKLPDMRGRAPIAAGSGAGLTSRTLGATGGDESVTLTSSQSGLPAHTHPLTANAIKDGNGINAGQWAIMPRSDATNPTGPLGGQVGMLDNTAQNAQSAHTNMQPYIALNYIIRAI